MKQVTRGISVLLIATIYCFAVYVTNDNHSPYAIQKNTENTNCFTVDSVNGFVQNTRTETSVNTFHKNFNTLSRDFGNAFTIINKRSDEFVLQKLTQYLTRYLNFEVRLRKSDILFPFHYFW
jgi:hypothetical protein